MQTIKVVCDICGEEGNSTSLGLSGVLPVKEKIGKVYMIPAPKEVRIEFWSGSVFYPGVSYPTYQKPDVCRECQRGLLREELCSAKS